jgi:CheY-like chemotaxis protein
MAKILLVEDDNNLREIYEARLQAEGYDIVAARDGEEALTVAMKERPDLIISDVMMPKISGFDMLDIIRSTEEIEDVKVIMMTALSQAEDKARAAKLGADRYLVKSQVTLEDVAKVAREVLDETDAQRTNGASAPLVAAPVVAAPVVAAPVVAAPVVAAPVVAAPVVAAPAIQDQQTPQIAAPVTAVTAPEPVELPVIPVANNTPLQQLAPEPVPSSQLATQSQAMAAVSPTTPLAADAQELSQPSDQEQAEITAQIDSFIDSSRPVSQSPVFSTPQAIQPTENNSIVHEQLTDTPSVDPQAQSNGKKIIQPLNDPTASQATELDRLLENEEQKDQMSAIAHEIASNNTERAEEFAAQEALRKAVAHRVEAPIAENSTRQATGPREENVTHNPDVAILEDGNLHLAAVPEDQVAEEATVQLEPVHPEPPQAQAQPNIPHTNGTSIDGVSTMSTPSLASPVQPPVEPPIAPQSEQANIADDIAL